ncbi:MAG: 4Fe-4S binding protein [Deltaproteobacteria bacterium]|nr:4Fe-4S binding protein [Deltaproteobacteria bacterium]
MTLSLYQDLAKLFSEIGFGIRYCPELDALLRALFTEEEAKLALNLSPLAPEPPKSVAERTGGDPDAVARMLDEMTDKGLIYCSQRGDEKRYKIIQVVPGIFELQFMKGEFTSRTEELAKLFDAYFHAREVEAPGNVAVTPFARVIPVDRSVATNVSVLPYETARQYIEQSETISLTTCYCRHKQRLLDKGCDHPDDVCLTFGAFADFVIKRGFGRKIGSEEALDAMERARASGLVTTTSNTRDRIDFICNCCDCCCGVLQSVKKSNWPSMAAGSNYWVEVDPEACVACGECADICPMEAIAVEEDAAMVDLQRCIGCGVCVTVCPSEALALTPRPERQEPFQDFRALVQQQFKEKVAAAEESEPKHTGS